MNNYPSTSSTYEIYHPCTTSRTLSEFLMQLERSVAGCRQPIIFGLRYFDHDWYVISDDDTIFIQAVHLHIVGNLPNCKNAFQFICDENDEIYPIKIPNHHVSVSPAVLIRSSSCSEPEASKSRTSSFFRSLSYNLNLAADHNEDCSKQMFEIRTKLFTKNHDPLLPHNIIIDEEMYESETCLPIHYHCY
ncbi:unnamed protein product [Amoebophrya sp. A25]|nr:unnamed protein product [Amoebophrya sp. A25]|eukprot:GSA25T00003360001.1